MSYGVSIKDVEQYVAVSESGDEIQCVVTTPRVWISIPSDYNTVYRKYLDEKDGIFWLHHKRGQDCVVKLEEVLAILGTIRTHVYWQGSRGNAGHTLAVILRWALLYPLAVFEVTEHKTEEVSTWPPPGLHLV